MKQRGIVSLHPDTAAKGVSSKTQGEYFINAEAYDLFYVCRSNITIEFIGMFSDKRPLYSVVNGHVDWVDREFVLI